MFLLFRCIVCKRREGFGGLLRYNLLRQCAKEEELLFVVCNAHIRIYILHCICGNGMEWMKASCI